MQAFYDTGMHFRWLHFSSEFSRDESTVCRPVLRMCCALPERGHMEELDRCGIAMHARRFGSVALRGAVAHAGLFVFWGTDIFWRVAPVATSPMLDYGGEVSGILNWFVPCSRYD